MSTSSPNKIHHNIPQILFNIIGAHITICFWGRGTGKTEGPGVDFTLNNMITMPRSLGGLVSSSYDKLLTFILPKLLKGYERYGYMENVHWWSRKFAPEELNIPKPFLKPTDPKHFFQFYKGSGFQLISLDRMGISNSADVDWIYGDEAKLFKYDIFKEVVHTNRGNEEHFGSLSDNPLSQHHSILLTTDRPMGTDGDWLYDIADQADPEALELTMMVCQRIFELKDEVDRSKTEASKNKKLKLIAQFEDQLNKLRSDLIYVSEASTLDNIHALGTARLKDFKRTLERTVFDISVLNKRLTAIENPFYEDLSSNKHSYHAVNHDYLDRMSYDFRQFDDKELENIYRGPAKGTTCKWYTDIQRGVPLDIAMDYNAGINNIVTGQGNMATYKFIHSAGLKGKIKTLLEDYWHPYFAPHMQTCKIINFYYDHTATPERADTEISLAETVIQELIALGWQVNPLHIGQQPSQKARYLLWQKVFNKMDEQYPDFRFNKSTCEYWEDTCTITRSRIGAKGFEKDKSDEKRKGFDQFKAPHITDAGDTLLVGAVHQRYKHTSEPLETATY